MKLILAIVNKDDSSEVSRALTKNKFSVTKLATQGGFLMAGNMTLLIGVEDDKVNDVVKIIESHSQQRTEFVPSAAAYGMNIASAMPLEVTVGGATIFVLNVEDFIKV